MTGQAILLHNPRCSKSREALATLTQKNIVFEVRDYLKEPLSAKEMKQLLAALKLSAIEVMRKKEAIYKSLGIEGLSSSKQFDLLVENPKLLERPIYWKNSKAAIGRPLENILAIL